MPDRTPPLAETLLILLVANALASFVNAQGLL